MPYTVPPLTYDYAALAAHIDEQTMRIHHETTRHMSIGSTAPSRARSGRTRRSRTSSATSSRSPRTSAGWSATTAADTSTTRCSGRSSRTGGGAPTGDLAAAIDAKFGSFDAFKADFKGPASTGSAPAGRGWSRTPTARRRLDGQSGQPRHGRQGADPRPRRLGARLLPQLSEPPPRLHRRVLERRELGRRRAALRGLEPMRSDLP